MKLSRPIRARNFAMALLVLASAAVLPAQAQIGLPGTRLPLPQQVGPLNTGSLAQGVGGQLGDLRERLLAPATLSSAILPRVDQAARLLRRHPDVLEADPRGQPAVRAEILAWTPSPKGLEAAMALGLSVAATETLDSSGTRLVTLRVPARTDTADLLAQLRAADPEGVYDFNHVYLGGASEGAATAGAERGVAGHGQVQAQRNRSAPAAALPGIRIGLVDSGIERTHPVFQSSHVRVKDCENGAQPSDHGTAVAALMIGQSEHFSGVLPQAELLAADVYCGSPTGGSAARIAQALGWLAREQAGVINLSLVGPPNLALERIVVQLQQRGHLLVAAVGNDGPAAAPLYPASYPGVVGVTAVDARGRVIPEAAQGPQVKFAAPGHHMVSAARGTSPYRRVRGTSFAAPIVAALLARGLPAPDAARAAKTVESLAREAAGQSTGPLLLNPATGYGIVGQAYRVAPDELGAP
jgi:subtilisin family serine protease